ncbi:CD225/dispanin family protein [Cellulomonas sp. HZM]|uniref:CD225/dispanin family protein n=1 Tax=Cellulomonas sp. HZM TaxID=1454010 RepID=UPI000492EF2C|nr:CD225/dispanin family protein [Cellulomonas sp. HZM]
MEPETAPPSADEPHAAAPKPTTAPTTAPTPDPSPAPQQARTSPYPRPERTATDGRYPTAIGWVIAAVILFWPTALVALLASHRAARAAGAGDAETAERESATARRWGIVSVCVGAALVVLSLVMSVAWALLVVAGHAWRGHGWEGHGRGDRSFVLPYDRGQQDGRQSGPGTGRQRGGQDEGPGGTWTGPQRGGGDGGTQGRSGQGGRQGARPGPSQQPRPSPTS